MKKSPLYVLLLCICSINAMEQPNIDKAALEKYKSAAMQSWQSTTQAYLEKCPETEESHILNRYIETFSERAYRKEYGNRRKSNFETAVQEAREDTPIDSGELCYILTGKVPLFSAQTVCTHEWNQNLKKLEEIIMQKSQN